MFAQIHNVNVCGSLKLEKILLTGSYFNLLNHTKSQAMLILPLFIF